MLSKTTDPSPFLKRMPKGKPVPFAIVSTALLSVASGGMLGLAVTNLLGGETSIDLLKAALLAGAGTVVSFGVNRMAYEKGAPQAAMGVFGAKLVSVGAILSVGAGLFAATYAGFVIEDVKELRLREHGQHIADHISTRNRHAAEANRTAPIMRNIVDDISAKKECEQQSNCLSNAKHTGIGSVTRKLDELGQRARSIAVQVGEGEAVRDSSIDQLNALSTRYQDVLDNPELDKTERRKQLQTVVAQINQLISELDEAVPTSLLSSYARELQKPVTIDGKPEASRKISKILAGHGDALKAALPPTESNNKRPSFPGQTGVSDTFAYLGHFLPIAAIVAVAELIFPISLWCFTYFALVARIAHDAPTINETTPAPRRGRPTKASKQEQNSHAH